MRLFAAALLIAATWATPALACQFNTDCNPGSKCMKQRGGFDGVCVGGSFPGRPDNDRVSRPTYPNPLDYNRTEGNQCSFNTDCGPGSMCLKQAGRMNGVCVKK